MAVCLTKVKITYHIFIYNIRHFVIKAWAVLQLFNGSKENLSQGVKKKRILIYKIGYSFLIFQKHLDFRLEGILSVSVPLISVQVVVVVVVQQRETCITNLFAQQPHTSVHDIISHFTRLHNTTIFLKSQCLFCC